MSRRPLRVIAEVTDAHANLLQLYTGLAMLSADRAIDLSQRVGAHLYESRRGICRLRVDGTTVLVDTRDSQDLFEPLIASVEVCAKRSFRPGGYAETGSTVIPYGLNYPIYPKGADPRGLARIRVPGRGHLLGSAARDLGLDRVFGWPATPRVSKVRPRPAEVEVNRPHIIFFARLWDPGGGDGVFVAPAPEELAKINEDRVGCIRALRAEFGPRFVGGIEPSPYASRYFADCVVDISKTAKMRYLRRASDVPIGVTTTGLSGSTGWKFGEYVAMGRAIVTQPLCNELPTPLVLGTNYLTFDNTDECVSACCLLANDPERVARMSAANTDYYEHHVRPDQLVGHLLRQAVPPD